jgi:hypothetical protein
MENTKDFSKFGFVEIKEAAQLLTEYVNTHNKLDLTEGISVEFNTRSGNVFLVDEDYNVAMLNDGDLEMFYSCPECGHEGFKEDFGFTQDKEACEGCTEIFNNE